MIKSIYIENLFSWKRELIEFSEGTTLIQGINHDDGNLEGTGKSAILNAITWTLYGKTPKEPSVKIDEVIRFGQKSAKGIVYFLDFAIVRTRKPNDLYILDKNQNKIIGKDAKETQEKINKLIGLSFDAFCQTIYFPQDSNKKFIKANQEEAGKILSEIIEQDIFDKGRKEVIELIKLENQTVSSYKHEMDKLETSIQHINTRLNDMWKMRDQLKKAHESKLQFISNNIENKQKRLNNLLEEFQTIQNIEIIDFTEKKDKIQAEIQGLENDKNKYLMKKATNEANKKLIRTYQHEVTGLESEIKNTYEQTAQEKPKCFTCGHELTNNDIFEQKINKLLEHRQSKQNQMKDIVIERECQIEESLKSTNDLLNKYRKDLNSIEGLENKNKIEQNAKNKLVINIKALKIEIDNDEKLLKEKLDLKDHIRKMAELNDQMTPLNQQLAILCENHDKKLKYINDLEVLKSSFKEVKTYIFNNVLRELTYKTNNYLSKLFEIPIKLVINNDNMKINSKLFLDGEEVSLGLLSGGQMKRVELATDLALADITLSRKGAKLNMRVLDEYFRNLSEPSMEKCLELLKNLQGTTLLIEHNSIFKSIIDNTLDIELRDKVSKVVK